jgi:hypothetical protein
LGTDSASTIMKVVWWAMQVVSFILSDFYSVLTHLIKEGFLAFNHEGTFFFNQTPGSIRHPQVSKKTWGFLHFLLSSFYSICCKTIYVRCTVRLRMKEVCLRASRSKLCFWSPVCKHLEHYYCICLTIGIKLVVMVKR